jgi:hypothetical protein
MELEDFIKEARRHYPRHVRRLSRIANRELDRERLLRRLGLASYTPGWQRALGGFGVFIVGAVIGSGLALAFSPKSGQKLREEVKAKTKDLLGRVEVQPPSVQVRA